MVQAMILLAMIIIAMIIMAMIILVGRGWRLLLLNGHSLAGNGHGTEQQLYTPKIEDITVIEMHRDI
ncbi:hypothetical protein LAZ67_8001933 [Cordylochernes scorpioides]|uniref:Uncharacterized protein n=1 Tax=Cordylochernes scorpioides TaxID=51811 RepID=A0ABY6KTU6_9ARAC|nr:hypothetical protein LAZ67_8001933 [Cordylochernes scorpioides]